MIDGLISLPVPFRNPAAAIDVLISLPVSFHDPAAAIGGLISLAVSFHDFAAEAEPEFFYSVETEVDFESAWGRPCSFVASERGRGWLQNPSSKLALRS